VQHGVPGDARIVHHHGDRAEIGLDALQSVRAGVILADVPFVDGNTRLILEFLRRGVIARVIGRNLETVLLQRNRNGLTDPSGAARNNCDFRHVLASRKLLR
jgi:hypothetical protein